MKKALSVVALTLVLVLSLAFIGCGGKINQKAADKINEAAENGKPMLMGELKDKYGDPAIEMIFNGSGYVVWLSCETTEELEKATENKEKVSALRVMFSNYEATSAEFVDNYNNVEE